eukprot:scaffold88164_cov16-Prasinocladus_malaysianus.AAC.1
MSEMCSDFAELIRNNRSIIHPSAQIYDGYRDIVSAIQRAGKWQGAIEIHPILVSRTASVFSTTWQSLNRLTYFAAGRPPNGGTPAAKRIIRTLHVHAVYWLDYLTCRYAALHRKKQPTRPTILTHSTRTPDPDTPLLYSSQDEGPFMTEAEASKHNRPPGL